MAPASGSRESSQPERAAVATRIAISAVAGVLLIVHLLVPQVKVDAAAIGLLVIASIPWLHNVFRSIDVSATGIKVEYRDAKEAIEKALGAAAGPIASGRAPIETQPAAGPAPASSKGPVLRGVGPKTSWDEVLRTVDDPNMSLVALRIEIERRVRAVAQRLGLESQKVSLQLVLASLVRTEVIDRETYDGLRALLTLGNSAAHGAKVDSSVVQLVADQAPALLESLDSLLENRDRGPPGTPG